ncbi:MAG: glycosyltransferase [Candidatus Lokiarchaeota archaeon]|nr:glycosyltransferase [Candidatus Lokiarchaeota archaeon]
MKNKMIILYITLELYPYAYGSGVHAYEVCRKLAEIGHKVIILTTGDLKQAAYEKWNNIEIYRLRFPLFLYYNQLNPILFWILGKKILNKINADVLIGHGFESSLFIKYSKIPIKIYKAVGTMIVQKRVRPEITWMDKVGKLGFHLNSMIEKIACIHSTRIIAISKTIKNELIENYKINPNKVHIIYNGINLNRFKIKNKTQNKNGNKIVLYVGRLSSIKGPQLILKIIPDIVKDYKNVRFHFIGNGPLYKYFKAISKRSPYIKIKRFIPHYNIPEIYAYSDLCIIPSYYEPFGLVALEAIASRTPILASNVGGLSEILKGYDEDVLIPIENLEILKNRVSSILTNDRGKISQKKAKDFLENNYSWKKNAIKTLKIIDMIKKKMDN